MLTVTPSPYPLPTDFRLCYEDLAVAASGLKRPECVVPLPDGRLLTGHGQGGYSVVAKDGKVEHHLLRTKTERHYVPNGIAIDAQGRILFADLGEQQGGIFRFGEQGALETVIDQVDGAPLPPTNFVTVDMNGAIWFTVSTRKHPRSLSWNHAACDGFIGVHDELGTRIVADGLRYTNEIAFSPDGNWLYANETYGQRISRYPLLAGNALGNRETVAQLDGADLPDGIAFDVHGGAWITCIASNRLLVIRPDGQMQVILEDTDPEHAEKVRIGVQTGTLARDTMRSGGRSRLANLSSLAFGGEDLSTAYLGCLFGDRILAFQSPVAGFRRPHWRKALY